MMPWRDVDDKEKIQIPVKLFFTLLPWRCEGSQTKAVLVHQRCSAESAHEVVHKTPFFCAESVTGQALHKNQCTMSVCSLQVVPKNETILHCTLGQLASHQPFSRSDFFLSLSWSHHCWLHFGRSCHDQQFLGAAGASTRTVRSNNSIEIQMNQRSRIGHCFSRKSKVEN